MIIYGTYKIDEILPEFAVNTKFKKKKKLGEFKIKANSERLVLFNKQYQENKKIICVACNLEANYFNLETSIEFKIFVSRLSVKTSPLSAKFLISKE